MTYTLKCEMENITWEELEALCEYFTFMPLEAILGMYRAILPVEGFGLIHYLIVVNMPFSLFKGLVVTLITFVLYKRISPIIKGKKR